MTAPARGRRQAVALVTLGCGRNEVDSDQVAGALRQSGFALVEDPDAADCVLVNTCTFIAPARKESIDTILAACDLDRRDGSPMPVLVIGCMAERYGAELAEALPEAAGVLSFADYPRLPAIVQAVLAGGGVGAPAPPAAAPPRGRTALPLAVVAAARPATSPSAREAPPTASFPVRTAPRGPWAYLKIAGGCDRVCTFCTIPSFRGRFVSRPPEELVAEARWLADQGVRELVCVSENTTSWGKDLASGRRGQAELIAALGHIEGIERVRLMYLQPAEIMPELLDAMSASPVVAPYYDLSLQHASARVLTRMGRSGDAERFLALLDSIRAREPRAVFRSSFIVGFPGETPADVTVLAQFLAEARLDWAGFFTFSAEDGTRSATMSEQVPESEARARRDHLVEVAEAVAEERAGEWIGRDVHVLVEEAAGDDAIGRCEREAPDTDGEVRLRGCADVPAGRLVPARVVAADGVDLLAEPLEGTAA
jgi:ribosomal protein S12 methylthiotransferase